LEPDYSYIVFSKEQYRPNFWINPKGNCFTVEGALKELKSTVASFLAEAGLNGRKPLWKDGCVSRPVPFFDHLVTGRVTAAKGNALLVGDAASLKIPLSGEGIGTALKSGILAARSILESIHTGRRAEEIYAGELRPLLGALGSCCAMLEELKQKTGAGLLGALARAFEASVSAPDF
jgi:hypothetical protein